jgi:hypothetical protein
MPIRRYVPSNRFNAWQSAAIGLRRKGVPQGVIRKILGYNYRLKGYRSLLKRGVYNSAYAYRKRRKSGWAGTSKFRRSMAFYKKRGRKIYRKY